MQKWEYMSIQLNFRGGDKIFSHGWFLLDFSGKSVQWKGPYSNPDTLMSHYVNQGWEPIFASGGDEMRTIFFRRALKENIVSV